MPLCRLQHAKYAEHMHKICRHMHKKHKMCAEIYAQNMQQICCYTQKYAQNLHNLHINMQNMLNIRKKNCRNMQKIYAENTHKICRICMSLCNIHIYALPTLLMLWLRARRSGTRLRADRARGTLYFISGAGLQPRVRLRATPLLTTRCASARLPLPLVPPPIA